MIISFEQLENNGKVSRNGARANKISWRKNKSNSVNLLSYNNIKNKMEIKTTTENVLNEDVKKKTFEQLDALRKRIAPDTFNQYVMRYIATFQLQIKDADNILKKIKDYVDFVYLSKDLILPDLLGAEDLGVVSLIDFVGYRNRHETLEKYRNLLLFYSRAFLESYYDMKGVLNSLWAHVVSDNYDINRYANTNSSVLNEPEYRMILFVKSYSLLLTGFFDSGKINLSTIFDYDELYVDKKKGKKDDDGRRSKKRDDRRQGQQSPNRGQYSPNRGQQRHKKDFKKPRQDGRKFRGGDPDRKHSGHKPKKDKKKQKDGAPKEPPELTTLNRLEKTYSKTIAKYEKWDRETVFRDVLDKCIRASNNKMTTSMFGAKGLEDFLAITYTVDDDEKTEETVNDLISDVIDWKRQGPEVARKKMGIMKQKLWLIIESPEYQQWLSNHSFYRNSYYYMKIREAYDSDKIIYIPLVNITSTEYTLSDAVKVSSEPALRELGELIYISVVYSEQFNLRNVRLNSISGVLKYIFGLNMVLNPLTYSDGEKGLILNMGLYTSTVRKYMSELVVEVNNKYGVKEEDKKILEIKGIIMELEKKVSETKDNKLREKYEGKLMDARGILARYQ